MDGYLHFIRIDSKNIIIDGYSEWQNDRRAVDEIRLSGEYGRHFTIQLTNEHGQFKYKLIDGSIIARTQEELDAEWNARPAEPPTINQQVSDMQDVINAILLGGI